MTPESHRPDSIDVDGSLVLWAGLFVALFFALELVSMVFGVNPVEFLVPALVLTFVMVIVSYSVFRQARYRRYSFAWYRATFPNMIRGEGRVRCRHCGGNHISVRNLMRRTFTRAHVCNQCGETLYYSAEK